MDGGGWGWAGGGWERADGWGRAADGGGPRRGWIGPGASAPTYGAVPVPVPVVLGNDTSTRRFFFRPSSVPLSAIG